MKKHGLIASALMTGAIACGGGASTRQARSPADDEPAAPRGATAAQPNDDAGRKLTASECNELAAWIVQVCHSDTTRSSQIEGWCSDITSRSADGAWQADDCAKHVRYVDFACFRSTESSRSLMACDSTVAP